MLWKHLLDGKAGIFRVQKHTRDLSEPESGSKGPPPFPSSYPLEVVTLISPQLSFIY